MSIVEEEYDYMELFLDSYDASLAYVNSYYYSDWPLFQFQTDIANIAAFKVIEAQIPFSWYVINSSNNRFLLTEGASTATVTLPVGNYNSSTLTTALQTALILASPLAKTYAVTFSGQNSVPNTGKFTIVSADASVYSLTFGDAEDLGVTNPRFYLGFAEGVSTSSGAGVLTGQNAANISGPNYLYINSRSLGTLFKTVLPVGADALGQGSIGPQIAKVPINVQPGGVIYWSDPVPQKWFLLENYPLLTQMDLYITIGNNDTPIATSLNGISFSVKIGLLLNKSLAGKKMQGVTYTKPY